MTDAGLSEAAGGLNDALAVANGSAGTRLQLLNLARNCLTAASLSQLAPCFLAADRDLEDLDLSGNNICIQSDHDAHHWETFLRSLGKCQVLKRLNLTGNNLIGSRAFEIFARVYLSQFHRDEFRLDQYMNDINEDMNESVAGLLDISENLRTLSVKPPSPSFESPAHGLPSIQNIMFANTSMTDAGALFLSYIVGQHKWAQSRLSGYMFHANSSLKSNGITYLPNESFSSVGLKLLKHSETIPYDPFEASDAPFGPENSPVGRLGSIAGLQSRHEVPYTAYQDSTSANKHFFIPGGRRADINASQAWLLPPPSRMP